MGGREGERELPLREDEGTTSSLSLGFQKALSLQKQIPGLDGFNLSLSLYPSLSFLSKLLDLIEKQFWMQIYRFGNLEMDFVPSLREVEKMTS